MALEVESWVKHAEKEVHSCLNYGGVFHDGGPTSKELKLAYQQDCLSDEVLHMRRFATALNELADALEAEDDSDVEPDFILQIYQAPSGLWAGRLLSGANEVGVCAVCASPDAVAEAARQSGIIPDRVELLETAPLDTAK